WSVPAELPYWILRVGAALCFIGHGAFGFITKAAWIPYFAVVGIPEAWAWRLMPLVGAVDVTVGMMVLFAPRRFALGYMTLWALWTALLRPLSGEPFFETVERAGNYGVPFVLLLMSGWPRTLHGWFGCIAPAAVSSLLAADGRQQLAILKRILQVTTVLLLAGHGALGAISGKVLFATHYTAAGLPAGLTASIGWFELVLAAVIAVRPFAYVLLFACAWKLATESLFIAAGAPVWELVERAGSFAAPLALALLMQRVAGDAREPSGIGT
ncbi:MAG: hypothetical protein ACRENH_05945, partial [Gemmatimonadaceae bacterium]